MKRLGLSVYPEQQNLKEIKAYLVLGRKYNFTRMFTSMLEITKDNLEGAKTKITEICLFAKGLGYEVTLDVIPSAFDLLGVKISDDLLSPTAPDVGAFINMGVDVLRIDRHYNGVVEKHLCSGPEGLKIEMNISTFRSIGDLLVELNVPKDRVLTSHNFYPQRDTGLSYEFFLKNSKHFKDLGFKTSAFITSQSGSTGPWPITEGLPTLEIHRDLPITTQAKHLWATGCIDDVMIGNAFASEEELKALSELNPDLIQLDVNVQKDLSDVEKEILFNFKTHMRRGDLNENTIRSTISRTKHKDDLINKKENKTNQIVGQVYILNDEYKNYKGELHIVVKELKKDSKKNLVATITKSDQVLLNYIGSWINFELKQVKK